MLAVAIRDPLLATLAGSSAGAVLHLVSHLIDHDLGGNPVVDIPVSGLVALLLAAAALSRAAGPGPQQSTSL